MSGYSRRNRKRRASYKKTNTLYENSYYRGKRRMGAETRIRRRRQQVVIAAVAVAAVLIIALIIGSFVLKGSRTQPAGENGGTPVSDGQTVTSAAAEATAAAETAAATEQPGGNLTRAVDAVETLSPDAIATPEPKKRSKAVALTFDDGPSTANTPTILSILKKYNAHATFFVVGNRVEAGADLLKQELEIGCEIGNHSWDHANLSKMSMSAVNKNLNRTKKLVKKLIGYDIKLVRPPYGAISDAMRKKMDQPMILWSVDTLDWKSRNAKAVFKEVKKQVRDGSIILVHDIHESTAEAMKTVIPWLVKNDYDILTVSELMERKGITMKKGKAYMSGD